MDNAYFVKRLDTLKNLSDQVDDFKEVEFAFSDEVFFKIFLIKIHVNDVSDCADLAFFRHG